LTADRQCGKMRSDELIDDYRDHFILAALAKQAAFPPWLNFFHQILNDVGPYAVSLWPFFFLEKLNAADL